MNAAKLAPLSLMLALLPSCELLLGSSGYASPNYSSLRIGGTIRYVDDANVDEELNLVPAIVEQAASDFRCPRDQVHVAPGIKGFSRGVEGCGAHGAYLRVSNSGYVAGVPGHEHERAWLSNVRFVRLDHNAVDTLTRWDSESAIQPESRYAGRTDEVTHLLSLIDQASRDLACPADQSVPGFWIARPIIPVADGCGQRATYLPTTMPPFVMQSKVRTD
jgi:hypothetical protein